MTPLILLDELAAYTELFFVLSVSAPHIPLRSRADVLTDTLGKNLFIMNTRFHPSFRLVFLDNTVYLNQNLPSDMREVK